MAGSNNSRVAGYLVPTSQNGNLEDKLFAEFLQPMIAGITGLPGNMVRPRWQSEPPNLPDYGTDWAAVGSVSRDSDTNAYVGHQSTNGVGSDTVFRNQVMDFIVSFYGPDAENFTDLLIMGFSVSQNLEQLLLNGYGFMGCGKPIMGADLLQQRWTRRVDVTFQMRRCQLFTYSVLDVESAQVTIESDQDIPSIVVEVEDGYGTSGYGTSGYGQ